MALLVLPFTLGMAVLAFVTAVVLGLDAPGRFWTWAAVVAILIGTLWFVASTGARAVPSWLTLVSFAVLIGSGYALGYSEWTAPLVAAAALGLMAVVRRLPRLADTTMPPTEFSRAPTQSAPTQTAPPQAAPPQAQTAPPQAAQTQPTSALPPLSLPNAGPPVRIRLLSNLAAIGFLIFGLGLLAFGVWLGWLVWNQPEPLPMVAKVLMTLFSVFVALLGLVSAVAGAEAQGDTLEINAQGIRRFGVVLGWDIRWDEIRAIGVMDNSRVIPHGLTATPRRVRERRDVRLVFALTDDAVGERAHFLPGPTLPPPFTHQQRLADLSAFRRGAGLVPRLDEALAARVPDRYLGYRIERPHQQLP